MRFGLICEKEVDSLRWAYFGVVCRWYLLFSLLGFGFLSSAQFALSQTQRPPTRVILVLDVSGSMLFEDEQMKEQAFALHSAVVAANAFAALLSPGDEIAIVPFGGDADGPKYRAILKPLPMSRVTSASGASRTAGEITIAGIQEYLSAFALAAEDRTPRGKEIRSILERPDWKSSAPQTRRVFGTNFDHGLRGALEVSQSTGGEGARPPDVIFLTDGLHGEGFFHFADGREAVSATPDQMEEAIGSLIAQWNRWEPGGPWPAGWRIHTLQLGDFRDARRLRLSQAALVPMASHTGGQHIAIREAKDLVDAFIRLGFQLNNFSIYDPSKTGRPDAVSVRFANRLSLVVADGRFKSLKRSGEGEASENFDLEAGKIPPDWTRYTTN